MSLSRHETLKPAKGHTQWLKWKIWGDGTPFSAWAPKFQRGQIRYDTRCYFNVRSKADISQLNLLHGSYEDRAHHMPMRVNIRCYNYLPFFSQSVLLFDKVASVYFIWKKYIYILSSEMASPGNQHCANCIGTLSFPAGLLGLLLEKTRLLLRRWLVNVISSILYN